MYKWRHTFKNSASPWSKGHKQKSTAFADGYLKAVYENRDDFISLVVKNFEEEAPQKQNQHEDENFEGEF